MTPRRLWPITASMGSVVPVELVTQRLRVILPTCEYAPAMLDYYARNRAHLEAWEPLRPPGFYTEDFWGQRFEDGLRDFNLGRAARLVVLPRLASEPVIIGSVNLSEILRGAFQAGYLGYSIDGAYEGKGVMREALQAVLPLAFDDLNLHRVMANHRPDNHRSARLLERLGFVREGYARAYLRIAGDWHDHVLTSLTNPHWRSLD